MKSDGADAPGRPGGAGLTRGDLVIAAQAGDQRALAELIAEDLPLIRNIVQRALHGHADVDDVVQETMVRVVQGLPGLREPDRFRAWVVAIAFRQIQERGRTHGVTSARNLPLDGAGEMADLDADFVDVTVERLGLPGQRRELMEASRWLSAGDRRLLALWWEELGGSLSRAELVDALGLSPASAAARLQRMKAQLRLAWTVNRARSATPRCDGLTRVGRTWDGAVGPDALRRFGRHIRSCAQCGQLGQARPRVDRRLLGIGMIPMAAALALLGRRLAHVLTLKPLIATGAAAVAAVGVVGFAVHQSPAVDPPVALAAPPSTTTAASPGRPSSPAATAPAASQATARTASVSGVTTADIYVAPTGSDIGTGAVDHPYASLAKAVSVVRPGETIALRGGTYRPSQQTVISISGVADRRIILSNYRDERPVIDAAAISGGAWTIVHRANYWTVQGLEIRNSKSHPYVCQSCRYDVFRQLSVHDNADSAFTLRDAGTIGNQILDSDFFDNHDDATNGEHADGLAIKFGSGDGNVVKGCRFFNNSDDGLDIEDFLSPVTIDSSWSYGNGVNRWRLAAPAGDGNGFALGAGAARSAVNHVVTNSAAWENATRGFFDSANTGSLLVAGNTAYRNGRDGFAFATSSSLLRNNLSLDHIHDATIAVTVRATGNSWNGTGWSAQALASIEPASAQAPRPHNGSLPPTSFLTQTHESDIGASMTRAN